MISLKSIHYLLKEIKERKVIIWGAGIIGETILNFLTQEKYKIDYFIDSSEEKQGRMFLEHEVFNPSKIKNLSSEYFIFVALEKYHKSVNDTLIAWGYSEYKDFFYTSNFEKVVGVSSYKDNMENEIISETLCDDSKVVFKGANNKLIIETGVLLRNTTITFRNDNGYCYIGKNSAYSGSIKVGRNCKVVIGEQLSVTDNCSISTAEATEIIIGNDCMFARDIHIYSHDYHPIFDQHTNQRINPSKSINIGNHVWLAKEVVVLSGSNIADGCVIGWRSVVKSNIPANSTAVGIPAIVKKSNIAWDRKLLS
ncbi:hypothetical protein ACFP56_19780 [Paenibacillus septentrionalis]|uniref:C-methyltransferase domain-containing protein n=1 Tax=Paenibacillus septentrionalis TaxID=429342 RepID=A0ABW1VAJ3_9BACL